MTTIPQFGSSIVQYNHHANLYAHKGPILTKCNTVLRRGMSLSIRQSRFPRGLPRSELGDGEKINSPIVPVERKDELGPLTKRPQIVLFGSSIVQYSYYAEGWGATLAHLYGRKADIVLRGYASWNSKRGFEAAKKLFPENATEQEQPALIIVYFGGNDSFPPHATSGLVGSHVPIEEYEEYMKKIANHLQTHSPESRLIFLSCPPVGLEKNIGKIEAERLNSIRKTYSDACLKLCNQLNIKAIDLWTEIRKDKDWKDVCFLDDGVHLSAQGSKIVSKEILKVLRVAEWEPSLYWRRMPAEFGEDSPYDGAHLDGSSVINVSNKTYPSDAGWEWE